MELSNSHKLMIISQFIDGLDVDEPIRHDAIQSTVKFVLETYFVDDVKNDSEAIEEMVGLCQSEFYSFT